MGFLNWFNSQEDNSSQTTVFGGSDIIIDKKEPTRTNANSALQRTVSERGGTADTHVEVNKTVGRNMLGEDVNQVCRKLGVRDRSGLPTEAKEALQTGDIAARHQISKDGAQGHEEIVESTDKATKKARGLFSW